GKVLLMPRISSRTGCSILLLLSFGETTASAADRMGPGLRPGLHGRERGCRMAAPFVRCLSNWGVLRYKRGLALSGIQGVRDKDLVRDGLARVVGRQRVLVGVVHQRSAGLDVAYQGCDGSGHRFAVLLDRAGH